MIKCCWVLLVGWVGGQLHAQELPEQTLEPQTTEEKAEAFYLEGLCQQLKGSNDEAFEQYSKVLELNPQHVGALYAVSSYWSYHNNDSLALALLERAAGIDAENYWFKQALVQLYVRQHRNDEAIATLEAMAKAYPQKSEVLMMLVSMYNQREDYENVINTLDRIELLEGKSEQLSTEKVRIYTAMKDEKRAFAEMQSLAKEYPNDIRYRVLIGDYYLDNGKPEKALSTYQELEQEDPENVHVLLSLANYYQTQRQEEAYQQTLLRLITNESLDGDMRLRMMQGIVVDNLSQHADTAKVMPLFRSLLAMPQEDTRMAELCARYMMTCFMPKEKVKPVFQQILDINPEEEQARNQLLSYAVQENDTTGIVRLCKTAVDYGTKDPTYHYFLSIAYYQQNRVKEAYEAVLSGLPKVQDSRNLSLFTSMYSVCGDLSHQMGNDAKAFECYDTCLLYRPDDALVLNNYAYYLSLRKQDLKRAEAMSLHSLEKEGNNPTYLDTYAWILFQQKRYEEARVVVDSVLVLLGDSIDSSDVNLVEHAGDIYFKCGKKERAIQLWQQALSLDPTAAIVEEKIRKKKYIEK